MIKDKVEVVILGGSGFIGSAIIDEFLSKNTKVLNLDLIDKLNKKKKLFFQ
mgnify:FL=1